MIGVVVKFVVNKRKVDLSFKCCILVPERSNAYWFKSAHSFRRVERYPAGSDLFRIKQNGVFVRAAKVKEPWLVLALGL